MEYTVGMEFLILENGAIRRIRNISPHAEFVTFDYSIDNGKTFIMDTTPFPIHILDLAFRDKLWLLNTPAARTLYVKT